MRCIIDENICKEYNLSPTECLILLHLLREQNIAITLQSLIDKDLISESVLKKGDYIISDKTKEVISAILVESEPKVVSKDKEITELAKEMQEIFPKGKKAGTTYYWRGSVLEVTRKLKILIGKYDVTLNKDKVLEATKEYVNSFNGDYTKMRLLKYFILKSTKDSDGNIIVHSDLMSLMENEGQEEETNWMDNVR